MTVRSLLSSILHGSIFGGSLVGRIVGWTFSVVLLSLILWALTALV